MILSLRNRCSLSAMTDKKTYYKNEKRYPSQMIQEIILDEIKNGELLLGERIDSERVLAEKYNVSRMAVQHALDILAHKGVVERRRGIGTFVRKLHIDKIYLGASSAGENAGITAVLKSVGATISNKVITCGNVSYRYLNHRLGLPKGESAYVLHRVRCSNNRPFALEYSAVPSKQFPDIDAMDFTNVSLYDYMGSYEKMPVEFNEKLQLIEVSAREAGYLEIGEGEPVYYMELTGFDRCGKIVEYTESYIRCDKVKMIFETRT